MKYAATAIRPRLILALCTAFLLGGVPVLSAAEAAKKTDGSGWILPDSALGDNWHLRLKDARAEAAKDNKPILILFTGPDWSSASKKMESSIIRSKEFTASIRPAVRRYFAPTSASVARTSAEWRNTSVSLTASPGRRTDSREMKGRSAATDSFPNPSTRSNSAKESTSPDMLRYSSSAAVW